MASTPHYTSTLLRHALPLVPRHGFSLQTLQLASQAIPSTSTSSSSSSPLSLSTLNALFPSPPPLRSNPSTRRHPNRSTTLTREQLIQQARDQARRTTPRRSRLDEFDDVEADAQPTIRVGPLKALVEAWLEQGRKDMVEHVEAARGKGKATQEQSLKQGLRRRIKYNEPVVDQLVEVSIHSNRALFCDPITLTLIATVKGTGSTRSTDLDPTFVPLGPAALPVSSTPL
ncbi:BQ2448_5432 [Microbotryum intermedium]|uniref:BQ2448_5432 protein n=1 Tax=Microbotryum intermedium TaxID=269621 RepID=A0A238F6W7_9BASI|nr:BQ2448_5432 [Microbotryum intermedium]